MILRHRAACHVQAAVASSSRSCSSAPLASCPSSSRQHVILGRQLHSSPRCRVQPPQVSPSEDDEVPLEMSPSKLEERVLELRNGRTVFFRRFHSNKQKYAKLLAKPGLSATDRDTLQAECEAKAKALEEEGNRLKAELVALKEPLRAQRQEQSRLKRLAILAESGSTEPFASENVKAAKTPLWITQRRLAEREAAIAAGTFRESIEDLLLSQPTVKQPTPLRKSQYPKTAKPVTPAEQDEESGTTANKKSKEPSAKTSERSTVPAQTAEAYARDQIAKDGHSFRAIDAKLQQPQLDHVPYVRRKKNSTSTVPLWKVLQDDPQFLDKYPEEERQYMYSHLPPSDTWTETNLQGQKHGFFSKARYFLTHRDTVTRFVDRMGLEELSAANGGKKITVIEAVPGAGTVTRELLTRDCVGKVVCLEERGTFREWVASLADDPTVVDSQGVPAKEKLHVAENSGYRWSTYETLTQEGHFDHLKPIREQTSAEAAGPPPPLVFVAQLPNSVLGDQFFVQIISAIGHGSWLFKYGRVKCFCVVPDSMALKALAPPGTTERAKISVLSRVVSHMKVILPNSGLQPRAAHIFPPTLRALQRLLNQHYIANDRMASAAHHVEMAGVEFTPRQRQVWAWRQASGVAETFGQEGDVPVPDEYNQGIVTEEFECLEFLMRNLFVLRGHSIADSFEKSFPGANGILPRLSKDAVEAKGHQFSSVAPFSFFWNQRVPPALADQLPNADASTNTTNGTEQEQQHPLIYHPAAKLAPMPKMLVIEPHERVNRLSDEQWITLARVFERWPFRPKLLQAEGQPDSVPVNYQPGD